MPPKTPRPPLTHFLCLPLSTPSVRPVLEKSLRHFKTKVLSQTEQFLVPELTEGAFRPVGTVHLTLGVMSLRDSERVGAACKFLEELEFEGLFRESLVRSQDDDKDGNAKGESATVEPLTVSLRGIEAMHSPTKTSVLYTPPIDQSNRLLPFATRLRDAFTDAEFLLPENRPLRLHATIVNTIYSSQKGKAKRGRGGRHVQPLQIDATKIMEEFSEYEFAGEVQIEKVAICRMGAVKTVDEAGVVVDEVYEEIASKSLPS